MGQWKDPLGTQPFPPWRIRFAINEYGSPKLQTEYVWEAVNRDLTSGYPPEEARSCAE